MGARFTFWSHSLDGIGPKRVGDWLIVADTELIGVC